NMTIKAKWTVNQYTLTFDTNGGSTIAPITQDYGTAITAPADPTKTGYTFAGWTPAIPATMPAENMTIKAKWTVNQYTLTFDTNGGSTIAPITQDYGTAITAPADPTKTGYTFAGWTPVIPTTMPAENMTIKAQWRYNGGGSSGYSYYTIQATAGTGGSISPSGNVSVREGKDQTFTITPDKGYAVANVKIDGKSIGAVKSYTFENVRRTHTIEVIFMKANGNPQAGVFVDVAEGSYYEEAIDWAVEKGITNGVSSNMFAPNDPCTRAQIVTFLWRAAGSPAPKRISSFTDVPADAFYAKAVAWAVENGITSGTGESKFSPNATCTRAQAVTFLYRASGSPAVSGSAEFSDVSATAFYADAVAWAAKKGITTGIGGGLFGADNDCTRGQIVTFLWRCKK
ncbi:MAG: S-layer homology domain-containing protein, partial [Oscillospiraceae bacterium]|nr:S-layer homology domain-containing protein [Oscillospiraceae bacterium]